jgi:hypothetical protein
MRLEATVPDSRAKPILQLAKQLGLSRSQLIDEALSLFLKAVVEARRGRRVMSIDVRGKEPSVELATPTLSAMEWALNPQTIAMTKEEVETLYALTKKPPKANARLRAAARRHLR